MNQTLGDRYFDLTMKVLNYAIEFLNTPGYSSLRLTDLLDSLVTLASEIEGVDRNEFYSKIGEKLNNRSVMSAQQDRDRLLNDILELYVEEWRKNK
jgi:hypothetical protein